MRIKQYTREQVFARPKMVKTLRTLTNSGPPHDSFAESGMRWWLDAAGYNREAVVFIAWKMATIIGWCYANEGYHGHWQISCYVHHAHRQKGMVLAKNLPLQLGKAVLDTICIRNKLILNIKLISFTNAAKDLELLRDGR